MPIFGGRDGQEGPDPDYEPLFTETDSESPGKGIFGQIARRCCRRFKVTVKKDFRITEKMVATVGSEYCLQTGKAEPVALVKYKFNDNVLLQVGNRRSKLQTSARLNCFGRNVHLVPYLFARYDEQFTAGFTIKLGNMEMPRAAFGFATGNRVDRKVTRTILPQTDETSGLDISTKFRWQRQGWFPNSVIREINTTIRLGPPLEPAIPFKDEAQTSVESECVRMDEDVHSDSSDDEMEEECPSEEESCAEC